MMESRIIHRRQGYGGQANQELSKVKPWQILLVFLFVGSMCILLLIFFLNVFGGRWILPQYFTLGPLTIHYYGLTMALAVGSGWWLAIRRAQRFGIDPAKADSFLTWLVLGGFLGARLYHVASSWQYYWQYPLDAFKVWHGGLSIYGALLGGFVVVAYSRKFVFCSSPKVGEVRRGMIEFSSTSPRLSNTLSVSEAETSPITPTSLRVGAPTEASEEGEKNKELAITRRGTGHQIFNFQFSIFNILDWLAPSVILGQIIGRFGNFFNYEAFGYPTSLPWKMFVPESFRPIGFANSQYYHPLFLYEALGNLVILLFLLHWYGSNKSDTTHKIYAPGALFFMYLFLYNALRFGLEHLRTDSTFVYEIFRLNALVSGLLCIVGLSGYLIVTYVFSTKKNQLD